MHHPRCVGYGEIGLDYHYNNSPPAIQQEILIRQLRLAVRLKKPLTIHTREADHDIERILKAEVPQNHPVRTAPKINEAPILLTAPPSQIHIHCFTDSPALAIALLDHFPNLYIGITGAFPIIFGALSQDLNRIIRGDHLFNESEYI